VSAEPKHNREAYRFLLVGVICLPGIFFVLFFTLFQSTITYIHYLGGIVVSAAAIGLLASVINGYTDPLWQRAENFALRQTSSRIGWIIFSVSLPMSAMLVSVTMFAWISYCLIELGLVACFAPGPDHPTYVSLVQTYAWHLVDLIPESNVKETLGMPRPPIKFRGWVAGIPILVFRLLIVIILFAGIRNSWVKFKSAAEW